MTDLSLSIIIIIIIIIIIDTFDIAPFSDLSVCSKALWDDEGSWHWFGVLCVCNDHLPADVVTLLRLSVRCAHRGLLLGVPRYTGVYRTHTDRYWQWHAMWDDTAGGTFSTNGGPRFNGALQQLPLYMKLKSISDLSRLCRIRYSNWLLKVCLDHWML